MTCHKTIEVKAFLRSTTYCEHRAIWIDVDHDGIKEQVQLRMCASAINNHFKLVPDLETLPKHYPRVLYFMFSTKKPKGDDWVALYPDSSGFWSDLRFHRDHPNTWCDYVTYACYDNFMEFHFSHESVVYGWLEYPE